jgi:DNA-binding NtrC family response regulator
LILRVLLTSADSKLVEEVRALAGEEEMLLSVSRLPEEMWEHLRSKPCDLLVVDRAFLGADPARAFQTIRGIAPPPEAIVHLPENNAEERAEMLEAGALACIASDVERHTLFRTIRALIRRARTQAVREFLASEDAQGASLGESSSKSPLMQEFLRMARKVTASNSSLLLLGETGVGKEFFARAIHRDGPRRNMPFVAVNCAALPEDLLESELFGHALGAFTGAHRARRGHFEMAHMGTLFLDEIGELPAHLQVKLLRVLQERTVQPVGSEKAVRVDVRLMAATNRDLRADMESKRFRSDLFYRLSVVALVVPALRDRREDIPDLVSTYIEHFRCSLKRDVFGVRADAMEMLVRYSWPGNVRELANLIERAVLLSENQEITPADMPDDVRPRTGARDVLPSGFASDGLLDEPLQQARDRLVEVFERQYLERLLANSHGRIGHAALRAGITPRALYEKMRRFGLRKETYRGTPAGLT